MEYYNHSSLPHQLLLLPSRVVVRFVLYGNLLTVIICPIAIAYSMGQIIKTSLPLSVCPSACTLTLAFVDGFLPKLAQT